MKLFLIAFLFFFLSCISKEPADIVLLNGRMYTMTSPGDTIQALVIKDGKIIKTGTNDEILAFITPLSSSTQLIDLHGRTVLPGFTDAHIHPISGGLALLECELSDITTRALILDSLRRYATHHPELTWIRGENMWLAAFKDGNPTKELLDSIIPDRPVFVSSSDGHNAWVNSKALQWAGVSKESPDPPYGKV